MQAPQPSFSGSIRKRKSKRLTSRFSSIVRTTMGLTNSYERISKNKNVKRGHIAMYVGQEDGAKRYEVPVDYLNTPAFQELIRVANDGVLDTKIDGPIEIRCTTDMFDKVLLDCANTKGSESSEKPPGV
ncbi:hypothetical protein JCGZ_02361 [Jatropha curcas]|uniref:Uncharacterized protein n=1 Tax=Jatropha curcas TaxID=180498 RepID=A0A067KZG1_JATCU|nr:hypothetical protein JCGZ_02361 [Jatropha curcas]